MTLAGQNPVRKIYGRSALEEDVEEVEYGIENRDGCCDVERPFLPLLDEDAQEQERQGHFERRGCADIEEFGGENDLESQSDGVE